MHRLFYIKFYDSQGKMIVRKDYTGIQFANEQLTEKFIQAEKESFELIFDIRVKLNPYYKEIPDFTIKDLIGAYCNVSGHNFDDVVGKTRKPDVVNVRMFVTKTALDLGFLHGQLRPFFKDGVSYHYEKKFSDMLETNDMIVRIWQEYQDKALSQLIEIRVQDGSGERK